MEGGSEEHFRTPFRDDRHDRDHREVNSQKLVLEQHSITLSLLTPPGNHAEVCFRATLHHFWLILVITATCQVCLGTTLHHFGLMLVMTATCQSLLWNNTSFVEAAEGRLHCVGCEHWAYLSVET